MQHTHKEPEEACLVRPPPEDATKKETEWVWIMRELLNDVKQPKLNSAKSFNLPQLAPC